MVSVRAQSTSKYSQAIAADQRDDHRLKSIFLNKV
jgi:hypothetical protein